MHTNNKSYLKLILLAVLIIIFGVNLFFFGNFTPPLKSEKGSTHFIKSDAEHDRAMIIAASLIEPYMRLAGRPDKPTDTKIAQQNLRQGITLLQAATVYAPGNWSAYWQIGKSYEALEEYEHAFNAFKKSFEIQKNNPDVAREYMNVCLNLGRAEEGLMAAQHAITLSPKEAGLYANLALAYLIANKNENAFKSIETSLRLDPSDNISQRVKIIIEEVINGKRPQPKNYSDLKKKID